VCAEPSPDAIRAVARELSLALQASAPVAEAAGAPAVQAQAAASAAARSAIASIAQRTPTIQLMRDMLYRVCEGVMNGVLDRSLAQFVTSQIDDLVIGLHAIDGLTGMPGAAAGAVSAAAANEATATVGETAEGKTPSVTLTATSTPATRNQLSDGAAKAIADAVVLIVREVTGRTEGTGNHERRR
jgi:hypothetical protein